MAGLHWLIAAVLIPAAGLAQAAEGRYGFKGIELGSSIVRVATDPKYECHTSEAPGADVVCGLRPRERETILGSPISSLFLFYGDGSLTSLSLYFDESRFGQVVAALRAKYGEPALHSETVRNRKDQAFENRIYTWRTPADSLQAERYNGRLDQSSLRFTADELMRQVERRRANLTRDPSQDI
jgi:hypothetical protein